MKKERAKAIIINNEEYLSSKEVGSRMSVFYKKYSVMKDNITSEDLWEQFILNEESKIRQLINDINKEVYTVLYEKSRVKWREELILSKHLIENEVFKKYACSFFERKLFDEKKIEKDSTKMTTIKIGDELFTVNQINAKIVSFLNKVLDRKENWTIEELWMEFMEFNKHQINEKCILSRDKILCAYWINEGAKDKEKVIALFSKRMKKEKEKRSEKNSLKPVMIDGEIFLTAYELQMKLSHFWNEAKRNKSYLNEKQLTDEFIQLNKKKLKESQKYRGYLLDVYQVFNHDNDFLINVLSYYSNGHKLWYVDSKTETIHYLSEGYLELLVEKIDKNSIEWVLNKLKRIEISDELHDNEVAYIEISKKNINGEILKNIEKLEEEMSLYNYYVTDNPFKNELKQYFKNQLSKKNGELNESGFVDILSIYLDTLPKPNKDKTKIQTIPRMQVKRGWFSFEEMKKRPNFSYWSIENVEREIGNIVENKFIEQFEPSSLEREFWDYWMENYYPNKKNPFMFPEVSGETTSKHGIYLEEPLFVAYKDKNSNIFNPSQEQGLINHQIDYFKTNVKFDFGIINDAKRVKLIVELNSNIYHPESIMINKDPVKKTIVIDREWKHREFYAEKNTGLVDIKKVFTEIHELLVIE